TPIGVLVAQGPSALEFAMRSRGELWPAVPLIFAAVDEETAARLNVPSGVTGTLYQLPFRNMVAAAQTLVPDLKRMPLVGCAVGGSSLPPGLRGPNPRLRRSIRVRRSYRPAYHGDQKARGRAAGRYGDHLHGPHGRGRGSARRSCGLGHSRQPADRD